MYCFKTKKIEIQVLLFDNELGIRRKCEAKTKRQNKYLTKN